MTIHTEERHVDAMSDADYEAVRKLAAEGRRIPDVVLRALMRRMELEDGSSSGGSRSDPSPKCLPFACAVAIS